MTRMALPALADRPSDGVVALRPWIEEDVPAVTVACQDPDTQRWTTVPAGYGYPYARAFISSREESRRNGQSFDLAVVDDGDGRVLGSVGVVSLDFAHGRGEIGYWMAPEERGRGVATRAVRLLSELSFERLGLARLTIYAAVGNVASQRVAERAGFTREGVLRSFLASPDGRDDAVIFGLLRPSDR